jgi:predicted DsbA family dithiol-disulfide isomerase
MAREPPCDGGHLYPRIGGHGARPTHPKTQGSGRIGSRPREYFTFVPKVPQLIIDVFSDLVCPWCFIGSRRLAQALETLGSKVDAKIAYHAYLLNSATPPGGEDLRDHLEGKFGRDPETLFAGVEAAAQSSGIPLDFSRVRRYSNTLKAHTLIRHALPKATQRALVDALFEAYFLQGRDIGEDDVLIDAAAQHGFTREEAAALIQDPKENERSQGEASQALGLGIRGVPFYIFGNRLAFSGAQAPETFVSAIEKALREQPETKDSHG